MAAILWTLGGLLAIACAPVLAVRIVRKRRAEARAEAQEQPGDAAP